MVLSCKITTALPALKSTLKRKHENTTISLQSSITLRTLENTGILCNIPYTEMTFQDVYG